MATIVARAGFHDKRWKMLIWFEPTGEPVELIERQWPGVWPPAVGDKVTLFRGAVISVKKPTDD